MCVCVCAICLPAFDLSLRHTCDMVADPLASVTNRGDAHGRHKSHRYFDTSAAEGRAAPTLQEEVGGVVVSVGLRISRPLQQCSRLAANGHLVI